jgi:hypothetical protein
MSKTQIPKMKKGCTDCPPPRAQKQAGPPLIVPRRSYTPTRPSCIACCEKHLGAAYVLLTEVQHGYAHRLRAIGHMHEAEDESQAWPELHNAIREARKAYQAAGTMPAWESLAQLADAVRGEQDTAEPRQVEAPSNPAIGKG